MRARSQTIPRTGETASTAVRIAAVGYLYILLF